jgi:transketolase
LENSQAALNEVQQYTTRLARRVRRQLLHMVHCARASHIGSSLSCVDILSVLYGKILRLDPQRPDWPDRDRFIMSKGHAAAAMYATLAERGFFPSDWLESYCQDGSPLAGHVVHKTVPGVEISTGSLGHGLPIACGMALSARRDGRPFLTYGLLSDGECNEGSTWEAALFAPQHCLDNLVAIIDYNKLQAFGRTSEVLDLEPFADKWRAFRWAVREVDGHDHGQLLQALTNIPFAPGRPSLIIAHTIKGKGVSFMEDKLEWHYRSIDDELLRQALAELGEEE